MDRVKGMMWRGAVWLASAFMIAMTALWTFWGTAEMFHEGWFGAWTNRLPYMAPIAITLVPAVLCFRRPIVGGVVLIIIGVAAAGFFGNVAVAAMAAGIALVGVVFVVDGLHRRRAASETEEREDGPEPAEGDEGAEPAEGDDGEELEDKAAWWRRDLRTTIAVGLALVIFVGVSAFNLPMVLGREDDGDRSARLIEGNGVALVWAPEGPGWNWKQEWGGYPSWQSIAIYGVKPIGFDDKSGYGRQGSDPESYVYATAEDMAETNLCRYLGSDGVTLHEEPQDVWRMPTADEMVRSLVRDGENAGCAWEGTPLGERVGCMVQPDKETPLWASDHAAIYYWVADEADVDEGVFVSYNGTVNATRKNSGNPRHSHRCVRAP